MIFKISGTQERQQQRQIVARGETLSRPLRECGEQFLAGYNGADPLQGVEGHVGERGAPGDQGNGAEALRRKYVGEEAQVGGRAWPVAESSGFEAGYQLAITVFFRVAAERNPEFFGKLGLTVHLPTSALSSFS